MVVPSSTQLNIVRHLLLPLAGFFLLFVFTYGTALDFAWASFLYELQGGSWLLQHHWLTETVLHRYVRNLNQVLVLLLLGYWLWRQLVLRDGSQQQRVLGILLLSLLLSFSAIAVLKRLLPMECPWHLQQFGGSSPFWGLFDTRPETVAATQCFPAGHASIGFAWLALYYYWRELKPHLAQRGLFIGLTLGIVLGMVQQLRGAHFISHDIATAALCWTCATLVYLASKRPRAAGSASTTPLQEAKDV